MSYGDVFTRINREYYQLTGAERKIADYIMLQRQDCQYMSISELAEVAEVAGATVSRFCRRLGGLFLNDFPFRWIIIHRALLQASTFFSFYHRSPETAREKEAAPENFRRGPF